MLLKVGAFITTLKHMNLILNILFYIYLLTVNEAQIRIDVKNMESQAIKKFTQRDYLGAGVIFEEAYSILNKILSSSNPECIKIAKSIEACRSKR